MTIGGVPVLVPTVPALGECRITEPRRAEEDEREHVEPGCAELLQQFHGRALQEEREHAGVAVEAVVRDFAVAEEADQGKVAERRGDALQLLRIRAEETRAAAEANRSSTSSIANGNPYQANCASTRNRSASSKRNAAAIDFAGSPRLPPRLR